MHPIKCCPSKGSLAASARFSSLSRAALTPFGIFETRLVMLLRRSTLFVSGLLALALAIGGCAAPGPTAAGGEAFNDPLEDTNRAIFGVNQVIDRNVLLPAAKTYRTVLIPPMRQAFHDFMQNLNAPVVFMNDILQGQFGLAANTVGRLLTNTSIPMGGMAECPTQFGLPYHSNRPLSNLQT